MSLPLEGVRVLELGQIIAGTYGGQILSDMGAEVIKIESPNGDLGRNPSVAPLNQISGLFLTFNRNKKSVVIDMKTNEGRDTFLNLVKCSDIVVDNFRPGVMERLGIAYPILTATNPRIIHCSITGFGSEGEYKNYPALDIIIQAISGHMAVTGESGRPPVWEIGGGEYAPARVREFALLRRCWVLGLWVRLQLRRCFLKVARPIAPPIARQAPALPSVKRGEI